MRYLVGIFLIIGLPLATFAKDEEPHYILLKLWPQTLKDIRLLESIEPEAEFESILNTRHYVEIDLYFPTFSPELPVFTEVHFNVQRVNSEWVDIATGFSEINFSSADEFNQIARSIPSSPTWSQVEAVEFSVPPGMVVANAVFANLDAVKSVSGNIILPELVVGKPEMTELTVAMPFESTANPFTKFPVLFRLTYTYLDPKNPELNVYYRKLFEGHAYPSELTSSQRTKLDQLLVLHSCESRLKVH